MWFDDPRPSIYVPHLTLLNTDPKWDSKLRKQILKRQATPVRRTDKRNKRGKGTDGSKREQDVDELEIEDGDTRDPFGWNYHLFRDLRKEFAKISFGTQRICYFELQANYKCVQRVYIDGKESPPQSTQVKSSSSSEGSQ